MDDAAAIPLNVGAAAVLALQNDVGAVAPNTGPALIDVVVAGKVEPVAVAAVVDIERVAAVDANIHLAASGDVLAAVCLQPKRGARVDMPVAVIVDAHIVAAAGPVPDDQALICA